ncbi:RagB/SusD family nutrient uptake outer membrane protein [Flavobacterium cheongpyeongense]|jgi:starch-binding outer membrane protein, SusD/RagB family|uniref:RagB/SusD family nutrient uptake outer membrane protein n=1 Tax=Flavobacterium cheongpyeongense TaxID=2212651 RepID=A0A2V4BQ50_9FLAO|nr:RagB/SusD family nutrient uptake outer membrane protein [Flavobacterium cheongpyeongense]PXY41146.1 RagB/SusD family nutrient uptake outer membrane protein [Flavobacterium cheongpyeongense]
MQTKIKTILAIFTLFISVTSCDDYLDLRPQDGIIREEFWKTKEDIQAAVIGMYSSLLSSPPGVRDLPMSQYLFMHGELRGDMIAPGPNVTEDERDIMNSNIMASNDLTNWAIFYRTINYCNTIIDLAPAVREKDPTLTQVQLNHFLSEALAIRAYLYFTLARTFKDVPLKLTATLTDEDNFQLPVTPQKDVFEQVIKDLKLAEGYAVESYGDIASDKGRITVYSINAMLADVYLWNDNFQEAYDAADKIVKSGKFGLIKASKNSWFNTVFAKGNSIESIFEFQYTKTNLGPFYNILTFRQEFLASATVLDDVFGVDFQNPANKDIRGDRTALVAGTNEIYKYIGLDNDTRKDFQEADTHWFVYRYADVLLLQAEALAELNRGTEAVAIIDYVRLQHNAIELTAESIGNDNKKEVIDYILAERSRELAFEGKRWFDMLRNARRNNYARLDILIDAALLSAPPEQQQSIVAKLKDSNSHYLPINTYELYTNKKLVQNPFYK